VRACSESHVLSAAVAVCVLLCAAQVLTPNNYTHNFVCWIAYRVLTSSLAECAWVCMCVCVVLCLCVCVWVDAGVHLPSHFFVVVG